MSSFTNEINGSWLKSVVVSLNVCVVVSLTVCVVDRLLSLVVVRCNGGEALLTATLAGWTCIARVVAHCGLVVRLMKALPRWRLVLLVLVQSRCYQRLGIIDLKMV